MKKTRKKINLSRYFFGIFFLNVQEISRQDQSNFFCIQKRLPISRLFQLMGQPLFYYFNACALKASALSVRSQGRSTSVLPK